jgi:hypothetical protein
MTDEACRSWDARPTEHLRELIQQTGRTAFYTPILHADFRHLPTSRPESERLDRISQVMGLLGEGLTGLDIGCNMGYMAHAFERWGVQMTAIDLDSGHLALAQALNKTYGLETRFRCCRFQEFESTADFDVTLALAILDHLFFRQEATRPEAVAARVGRLTRHALFWESGEDPAREIALIQSHTPLTEYLSLGPTYGTGKHRELGLFLRPGTPISDYMAARHRENF